MIYFRNDDVNPSTDFKNLMDCYREIYRAFPDAEIISGVTLFGKNNSIGSIYEEVPFKNKPQEWFYNVDDIIWRPQSLPGSIASHGLIHFDHSKASLEAQEMSIITSCKFLKTNIFIPPFNRYNTDTLNICQRNEIQIMLLDDGWKSMEYEDFNPDHKKWYFHSWRYTPEKMREAISCKFHMD